MNIKSLEGTGLLCFYLFYDLDRIIEINKALNGLEGE